MRTSLYRAAMAALSCAAMAAGAQSYVVVTSPDPVVAGHPFTLTVIGLLKFNHRDTPVAAVQAAGPTLTINLGRECSFAPCPGRTFDMQTVSVPGLAAGTYVARIFDGPQVDSADPDEQAIFTVAETCYQGLWWNAPAGSQAGWGLALDQQGSVLMAAWFTYDSKGKAAWLVMPRGDKSGPATFSGTVYRTTGPPYYASPWDPAAVNATEAGSATLAFLNERNGTFSYTIDGVTDSRAITRQVFSAPVPTCAVTN